MRNVAGVPQTVRLREAVVISVSKFTQRSQAQARILLLLMELSAMPPPVFIIVNSLPNWKEKAGAEHGNDYITFTNFDFGSKVATVKSDATKFYWLC